VHRDIKPSNVMLRGDDPTEAILMDFGIAKIEDGKTRLTGSGAIGTIDYMSPEQILAAKEVDKRSDVYALGVIAYEMLTGERPFEGNAAQVMFAHLQKPVTDPRQHRSDLSETIASAILKALEKQPEDRFESAGAFVGALL
jgi:serine/threonine protein kinase